MSDNVFRDELPLPDAVDLRRFVRVFEHVQGGAGAAKRVDDVRERFRESLSGFKRLAGPADRDTVDLIAAQLFGESPWLREPISWIWQRMLDAVERRVVGLRLPPLLIVGPAGCGKTHLATLLADSAGVPSARIDMSMLQTGWPIVGLEHGWKNAGAGTPARLIAQTHAANPLIVLDEIDKATASALAASAHDALLPLLQSDTAATFTCPYAEARLDLSHVNWIALANTTDSLPAPLLDRFSVLRVPAPKGADLHQLVERKFGPDADAETVRLACAEMEAGRLSLRSLDRLAAEFRAIARRPVLN